MPIFFVNICLLLKGTFSAKDSAPLLYKHNPFSLLFTYNLD